ncbi:host specificity factor TipJ family phage tail protein [Parasedimentitalea huanghaiensis]|uniref:Tip attachment protein J HDII-ins2 domain-containing protein n=1 Tax=Parasedimentitalea huanghaiensis TaxID=2682100 RepID=A0A6L6WAH5_9RHOB|nr:hypothetical protein [Zongyanglinia huanghaiensis]
MSQTRQEGASVADIVRDAAIEPRFLAAVQVTISRGANSSVVPMDQWHRVRPRSGSHVLIGPRVNGPLAGLLLAAVLPSAAGAVAGAVFASGTLGYALVYAAVSIVGSLLINALIPPPVSPGRATQDDPNHSITGSGNAENRYGVYPTVLGRHQIFPPKTARGYTEGEADNIYFRGRYTFGYGPVALETLRIGTTPITEFEGVELEFLNVDEAETLANLPDLAPLVTAWRQGTEAMSLYPDDVAEDNFSVGLEQDVAVVRTTRDRAVSVTVDVTYQGLVAFDGNNNKQTHSVDVGYRYRRVGDLDWIDAGTETHSGASTANLRFSKTIQLPDEGEYDVEVTRQTEDSEATTVRDDAYLTALRSVQSGSLPSHADIAEVAIRVKASDQLNGQLQDLNGVALQMAPVWNGATWSAPQPVRHPAWIYARSLMGPMLARPIGETRIQIDDLLDWAQQEPHWTCDAVIDQSTTVAEVLDMICATGRARRTLRDLKYSIIRDGGAGPVVQQFSPRNSYGFKGSITFPKEIHGFRVRCLSERLEWQQDEIVAYADGYDASNASEFETLDLRGVVLAKNDATGGNAWRLGRYHLAQAILRPEEFSWSSDLDHLRVNMGDKVRLVHDVPLIGVGSGRISQITSDGSGNLISFTLDEFLSPEAGDYRICLRRGSETELVFRANPPTSYDGIWTVAETVNAAGIKLGDLVSIEEMTQESMEVLITSIQHGEEMQAKLKGVPAAPAVLLADQGAIPPYVPTITTVVPRETLLASAPRIIGSVIEVAADPARVQWVGEVVAQDRFITSSLLAVLLDLESGAEVSRGEVSSNTVTVDLPFVGDYALKIYSRNGAGVLSAAVVEEVSRDAAVVKPDLVQGFGLRVLGDQAHLTWDSLGPVAKHYAIRHLAAGSSGCWNEAVDVERAVVGTSVAVPALAGSYLIKAVGHWGDYSAAPTVILSTIADLVGFNVVQEVALHPDFVGDLDAGLSRTARGLQLLPEGLPPQDSYQATFTSSQITDLSAVMTSRVTAALDWFAFDLGEHWSEWGLWFDVATWSGSEVDPAGLQLQISTTTEDPNDQSAVWTDWAGFLVGDYLARGFRFRVVFTSTSVTTSPVLKALTVTIDVPDRIVEGADIVCPAEGVQVSFDPPFLGKPAIAVDGQGLPVGARSVRTAGNASGFHQQFLDDLGQGVACTFDYIAKGYGRLQ